MKLSVCTEWLFFHIWKSNPETSKSCEGVIIPETIIYRWAWPYFWYFTNKEGRIVRKTKEKIQIDDISQIFTEKQNSKDIVAVNMSSNIADDCEQIEFEYFISRDFSTFLSQREKKLSAILQRFVHPSQNKNQLIKAIWTPQFCLFFRRQNINDIKNTNLSVNDRVSTFNGLDYLSTEDPIKSPSLQKDIENLCINIVKHIQAVSQGNVQISRMVIYLKLDYNSQLQLLFCTDIKIRDKYSNQIQQIYDKQLNDKRNESPILTIIDNQKKKTSIHSPMINQNQNRGYKIYQGNYCLYCLSKMKFYIENDKLFDLNFKKIIDSYDKKLMTNKMFLEQNTLNKQITKKENYLTTLKEQGIIYGLEFLDDNHLNFNQKKNIPLFLEYIWGHMTQQQYEINKTNATWQLLSTKVCQECFMDFTQMHNQYDYQLKIKTSPNKNQQSTQKKIKELSIIKNTDEKNQTKLKKITNHNYKYISEFSKNVMNNKTKNYFFNNSINQISSNYKQSDICEKFQSAQKVQKEQLENKFENLQRQKTAHAQLDKNICRQIIKDKPQSSQSVNKQNLNEKLSLIEKFKPSAKYKSSVNSKSFKINSSFASQSTLDISKSKISHTKMIQTIQDMRIQMIDL